MGNRAIIKPIDKDIGVYLHWNGGRDSVEAFLTYCKMRGFRDFGGKNADGYGIARFIQVVSKFFGGSLCVGVETNVEETESYAEYIDNGIYVIDGWSIVKRIPENIKEQNEYDINEFLQLIDERQPIEDQFGKEYLQAKEVPTNMLEVGDYVFIYDDYAFTEQKCKKWKITKKGKRGLIVNGQNVFNIPYIDKYPEHGENNINNYLLNKSYRVSVKT